MKLKDRFHKVNLMSNIFRVLFVIKIIYVMIGLFSNNSLLTLFIEPVIFGYLIFIDLKINNILKPRDGNPTLILALFRALPILLKVMIFLDTNLNFKFMIINLLIELAMGFVYIYDVEEYSEYVTEEELMKKLNNKK